MAEEGFVGYRIIRIYPNSLKLCVDFFGARFLVALRPQPSGLMILLNHTSFTLTEAKQRTPLHEHTKPP